MKKIDLHIHTKSSISDSSFSFNLQNLKNYAVELEIDCIAITNHNLFDLEQFNEITEFLDIKVFPGIEIDLEGGHLLLISEDDELIDFSRKCKKITDEIKTKKDNISVDKLKEVFPQLEKYLLIPHYDKKPKIKPEVLSKLNVHIFSGEVASIRKFKACIKDEHSLVPVIFSDLRICDGLDKFSNRQTFISLEELTIRGIKACLMDKNKVFLSKEDGNDFFQANDKGLLLSTGLNVILGERSSGKTFTLNSIYNSFENVKYIEQFSLLQNDEEKFERLLSIRQSNVSETYLKEIKDVLSDVSTIDLKQNDIDLNTYLTSLLKYASESEKADSFANASLFGETTFTEKNLDNIQSLIKSVEELVNNSEYRDIIDEHISKNNLMSLSIALMEKYTDIFKDNLKKRWINNIITNIQDELRFRTTTTFIEEIDLYKILMDNLKIEKYSEIVNYLKTEREIHSKNIRNFKVVANSKKYTGALQLKNKSRRMLSFSEAFSNYSNPYEYLESLRVIELEETEFYKYFIDFEYKTLNKDGFPVSGGERSEFNLLHEINDALKHDILLIDEPESSFDNIFLKNQVNELIKDISKEIPVVVVTHNNTVGASIKPDFIVYTHKKIDNGNIEYQVYTGFPHDRQLKTQNGEVIDNYGILLNCLEAGKEAYIERRTDSYEILEN